MASRTVIAATQARIRFGELLRRVVESGEVIVVERDGTPQAVVLSLSEYERLASAGQEIPAWEIALRRAGEIGSRIRARLDMDLPPVADLEGGEATSDKPVPRWEEALKRAGDIGNRIQARRADQLGVSRPEGADPPRTEGTQAKTYKPTADRAPEERRDTRARPPSSETIRRRRGERDAGLDDNLGVR